jgi:hypothetical protein
MPIYRNVTGAEVTAPGKAGNITIPDKQTVTADFFIPDEYGLTLLSESPRVVPQIMASGTMEIYNGVTERIDVPECAAFEASFVCKSGRAFIRESYADAAVSSVCDAYNTFRASFRRACCEAFYVIGEGDDVNGPSIISYLISRKS